MIKRLQVRIPAGAVGDFFFFSELTLCADYYSESVLPLCYPSGAYKILVILPKVQVAGTPKHAYTLDPTKSEWADYAVCCCPGIVWEPIRKRAYSQFVKEHLTTIISAC